MGGDEAHFHSPVPAGSPLGRILGQGVRRELALAYETLRPRGSRVARRVVAGPLAGGVREDVRRFLGAGWITSTVPAERTSLAEVLQLADAIPLGEPVCGADGSVHLHVVARGVPAILRIGRTGSPEDPGHAHLAMSALYPDNPLVPRPIAMGETSDLRWTTEERLPGRRPDRIDGELVKAVTEFCAALPRAGLEYSCDPAVPVLLEAVPGRAEDLLELTHRLTRVGRGLEPTSCHGDLWRGNCLVDPARHLCGVVDWDSYRPAGLPGSDLLHLIATDQRHRLRASMGTIFSTRPWDSDTFVTALRTWRPEVADDPEARCAVGLDWWLHQVTADLRRNPQLADHGPWVERNVLAVLNGPL